MTTANCPSCGAQIEFAIGSSEVVVCSFCRSIVARTDRGLENHGKVAALIDTGSPLRVGANGNYRRQSFRITGRTQLRHQAGGVWDEWYASLDDGRWAWLAEAQGRFYVTFKVAAEAPPLDSLQLGDRVLDNLVVGEIGEAELISAEGELPWTPNAGARYDYADLSGAENRFATIDYSEDTPIVFEGEEVPFASLQIEGGEARREARAKLTTLNCTQCGGALELRAPDQAERIYCPYCGSGHDITSGGKLEFFKKLKPSRTKPVIPLGSTGTIDGDAYVIAGFMERAVHFDIDYFWTEYLLFNREKGFRWLVHSEDHWSFVTPLRPGDVNDVLPLGDAKTIQHDGRTYKIFSSAIARVTHVLGEFYWKVEVGEQVNTFDYVAPPFGISKEISRGTAQEINYSHARYMQPKEVEQAFGVENLVRPSGVGSIQPYTGPRLGLMWLAMLVALFVAAVYVGKTQPNRVLVEEMFDLGAQAAPDWNAEKARVFFTKPFELTGRHNVEVQASSPLSNNWIYLGVDLVDEADGKLKSFEMPLEYYSGVEDGESWSEGKHTRKMYLSAPKKGPHVLRIEAHWEGGKTPPSQVHIRVREGVFRGLHFILALIAISIIPFIAIIRQAIFESRRWSESSYSSSGSYQDDEDEEEEEEEE